MINVKTKAGVRDLHQRIAASREKLQPYRVAFKEAVTEYVGSVYPQDRKTQDIYLNLFHQAVETFILNLAGGELKPRVFTAKQDLKATAVRLQLSLEWLVREIGLAQTIRQILLDAMFRIGIAKIYLGEGRTAENENDELMESGLPFVKRISFDDFVYDTTQKRWSEIRFACDEYELPKEALEDDDFYDQKVVREMTPGVDRDMSEGGDTKTRQLSTGTLDDPAYKHHYVTLMDVWIPEKQEVAILSRYNPELGPLAVVPWYGLKSGPYEALQLGDVPDNIMPVSLADQLKQLHKLFNLGFDKLVHQAEEMKTVPWYEASAAADVERLRIAGDWREAIKVANREGLGVFKWGDVDQGLQRFVIQVEQLFDRGAGNLQAAAGLGPQSGTVGQDELILGQVRGKQGKYAEKVVTFCNRIGEHLLELIWQDDVNETPGEMEIPGVGGVDVSWSAAHREGARADYYVQIDPYALPYEGPQAKLAKLEHQLGFIVQLWPMFQESGGILDPRELLSTMAEFGNSPWMKDIVKFIREPAEAGTAEAARNQTSTRRENVRRNVTNPNERAMLQDIIGQNPPERSSGAIPLGT